jgi:hypothetical protein
MARPAGDAIGVRRELLNQAVIRMSGSGRVRSSPKSRRDVATQWAAGSGQQETLALQNWRPIR